MLNHQQDCHFKRHLSADYYSDYYEMMTCSMSHIKPSRFNIALVHSSGTDDVKKTKVVTRQVCS